MNNKSLVIGYGSIGARHAAALQSLNCGVACVSKRLDVPVNTYKSIEHGLSEFKPELVIVSNPTSEHYKACKELERLKYKGLLLIEKPVFDRSPNEKIALPENTFVAYNLRFNPIVQRLRAKLDGRRIFSAQFSVGQYLPTWRPDSDYRNLYSASKTIGGGVLRDLSHELDLTLWLLGGWVRVSAICGKFGNLEINSEDTVEAIVQTENCPSVSIHLDYHSLFTYRRITIHADGLSLEADLIESVLKMTEGEEFFEADRNETYISQIEALLSGDFSSLCPFEQGIEVLRLIEAIEKASENNKWELRK